jgi:hypothetical protein
LKNTTVGIIDAGCCPLLKHLEGNKNKVMNILFINDGVIKFRFVYNSPIELRRAIREDPETHDFVKRDVRIHHYKV